MTELTLDFVKEIYNSDLDSRIKWARDMNDVLLLHIEGIGIDNYLERINNYENQFQFEAREKHAISNKFITEELLRPTDNAFNARGGSKKYKFKTSEENKELEFAEILSNVKNGSSLSQYVEEIWFNKFLTDPNGLIFIEESTKEDKEKKAWPAYKSIHSIRAYKQNGIFVDWVIFEPHRIDIDGDKKETKIFWGVDNENFYLFKLSDDGLVLVETIEHSFDKVPAILCSNIVDNKTGWKKSPIDAQVELLNKYLTSNSVLSIAEFFHNYPIPWTYVDECSKCNGTGVGDQREIREGIHTTDCNACNGTGKASTKDVTDTIQLRVPSKEDHKIDPPAGYITLPTDSWELMTDSVDRTWGIIYFSHWGTTVSKDGKNETATGRFLDAQPVNNRLNKYSKSIEQAHTALANFFGQYNFPETFQGAFIQYGRRYLIETPDQIWEKYLNSKKDNAPVTILDLLLFQFIESEFRENEQLFIYETKKAKLEPFVHWDIKLVQGLNVNQDDYNKKLYFSEWIQSKTINEIIKTDLKKLDEELSDFVLKKSSNEMIENENETL